MACVEPAPLAQEHIWHVDSYTKHVVQILETSRGFMLDGEPKTIGGPSRVTRALKQSCIREMQTWIVLAAEVLKTECPNYGAERSGVGWSGVGRRRLEWSGLELSWYGPLVLLAVTVWSAVVCFGCHGLVRFSCVWLSRSGPLLLFWGGGWSFFWRPFFFVPVFFLWVAGVG